MSRTPITLEGAARLRTELQQLKSVDRPKVILAIAEARAHGDLRENAEYHAAREQQGFIEGRIAEIASSLSNADIIDTSKLNAGGRVVFGASVLLVNVETDEEVGYKIVGNLEADISAGLLSIGSPTARALIGKEVGDEATVNAPGGELVYEILEVSYG